MTRRNPIYIARRVRDQLWTPPGAKVAHDNTTQYLPDIDAWVSSSDFLPALRSRLRSYPLDEFLALVSRASFLKAGRGADLAEYMKKQDWDPSTSLRIYQMAFLVRLALEDHEWDGERGWAVESDAEKFRLLADCTEMAQAVVAKVDAPESAKPPGNAWAILQRIANQQFGEFEPLKRFFPRALLLFGECARNEESRQGISLDEIFRDQTGLAIEEAMFLAFGIYALLGEGKRGHILSPEILTDSPHFPGITKDKMDKFFDWLSIDFAGFIEAANNPQAGSVPGHDAYNFNPLVEFPIIRLPSGLFVIPIAHYLFQRVTTGLFYDLIRSKLHKDRAGNIIGRAIEMYVARLVDDLPTTGRLISEVTYGRGNRTSEWILDEEDAVVVIECKRRALLQRAKTTGQRADLMQALDTDGGIADGLVQLKETELAIRAGLVEGVDSKKRVVAVLITLDHFYNANIAYVREILHELVKKRRPDGLGDLDYQICPIPDFEEVCRLLGGSRETVASFFVGKIDGANNIAGDFPTSEWDCGQYTTHIWPEGLTADLPSHDPAFEAFVARMAEALGREA